MTNEDLQKLKTKLPTVPGILGKNEYFNSAVLIPLIFINGEYNFLFEKRTLNIRQGGEICFPGGEYDKNNDLSFLDTALRETEEEIGIDKSKVTIIGALDTLVGSMGVTVDSFIATLKVTSLTEILYNQKEVEKVFLIPVSFFENNPPQKYFLRNEVNPIEKDKVGKEKYILPVKELNLPNKYHKPWQGRKHKVFVYQTKEGIIWGITAKLVYEVTRLLKLKE